MSTRPSTIGLIDGPRGIHECLLLVSDVLQKLDVGVQTASPTSVLEVLPSMFAAGAWLLSHEDVTIRKATVLLLVNSCVYFHIKTHVSYINRIRVLTGTWWSAVPWTST